MCFWRQALLSEMVAVQMDISVRSSGLCTVPNGGSGEIPMLWRRASVSLRLRSKSESSGAASAFCCVSDCPRLQTHTYSMLCYILSTFWMSLIKCHLTSFFFFSSSFLFFSSLIWARRCFLRSSSAFRSLLSAILSCDTIITPQTDSFAHLSRCKQGRMETTVARTIFRLFVQ